MDYDCQEMTYTKADPGEVILIGDIIMMDPATSLVRRAVAEVSENIEINSKLIVGVCTQSDNTTPISTLLDGGNSLDDSLINKDTEEEVVSGGVASPVPSEIITVAYTGEQLVNICGYSDIDDNLCISSYPGKAKSMDYLTDEYDITRAIGKVIKLTANPSQVKVLLELE